MIYFIRNVTYGLKIAYRKPKVLLKLINGYCRSLIGRSSPNTFMIAVDYSCNFKCQHCSSETLKKPGLNCLNAEEYKKIARDSRHMGFMSYCFTGGEPLIDKKYLLDLIGKFNPQENLILLQTNGWYIDEKFLDDFNRIKGDIIYVSLDSATQSVHDKFRGKKGAWDKAMNAVNLAMQKKIQIVINYTLTHERLVNGEFNLMIQLTRKLGVHLFIVLAAPVGRWAGNYEVLLNNNDRKDLEVLLKKYSHLRVDRFSTWKGMGCPAAKEVIYLTPYGELLPCPFTQKSIGNVRNKPLKEIHENACHASCSSMKHPVCHMPESND